MPRGCPAWPTSSFGRPTGKRRSGGRPPPSSEDAVAVPAAGAPGRKVAGGERSQVSLRSLGGGLRSWLGVRCIRTPALNLTAPLLLRLAAPLTAFPGPGIRHSQPGACDRRTRRRCGGFRKAACGARQKYPRSAGSDPTSGTRSERAQGRERSFEESSASQGPQRRRRGFGRYSRFFRCRRTYQTIPATIAAPITRSNLWK
jgi:hypothetical protein